MVPVCPVRLAHSKTPADLIGVFPVVWASTRQELLDFASPVHPTLRRCKAAEVSLIVCAFQDTLQEQHKLA